MLDALRRGTGSILVKGLLGLLVISFAVWGVGDIFRGPSDAAVAVVGDIEILRNDFNETYRREVNRVSNQLGSQLDSDQARQFGLPEFTLQKMVRGALIDQVAKDFGVTVPDSVLLRNIHGNRAFQNLDRFDPAVYEDVLRNNGFSKEDFEHITRRDLVREQVSTSIQVGAVSPQNLVDALYRHRAEKRVADVVVLDNAKAKLEASADEAALEALHKENASRYTAPEYRGFAYLTLDPVVLSRDIEIPESRLREDYEQRLSEFTSPERRDLSQMLFDDKAKAQAAYDRLKGGDAFEVVAASGGSLIPDSTELGVLTANGLPPEVADAAFAVAQGEVSAPLESALGWHIFRANKVEPGGTQSFEAVRDKIRKELALQAATDDAYELSNKLQDELASGASLEETANRLNLEIGRIQGVDPEGRDRAGGAVTALPSYPAFLETAFAAEQGRESELVEIPSGGYFVLRVDAVTAPALKPLASVRQELIADWTARQQQQATARQAKEIVDQLKQGQSLQALAQARGLKVKRSKALTRHQAGTEAAISGGLLAALFAAPMGGAAEAPTTNGDGHAVATLVEIKAADPSADKEALDNLRNQLRGGIAADLMQQFEAALRREFGVTVNRQALEQSY